jgi:phosphotransferase system HPr (HPr) family protein|tara:strand:- start:460 stop:738 length:279 start_codon:yes stop_codon:yes gene_type:complete
VNDDVKSRKLKIENEYGIHARPAALIVKEAARYTAEIYIEKNGNKVSCKSIMGLMTIEGFPGSWVTITAKGSDAEDALDSLEALFVAKFNEV